MTQRPMASGPVIRPVRTVFCALFVVLHAACGLTESTPAGVLPSRLTDAQFWQLSTEWSEAEGSYQSEAPTSNESLFQHVIPALVRRVPRDAVYVGVGPEQNFTYIAAVRPRMAIIVDIRRRNLQLHLMYKALFELAADRSDFVSKLFAKPRPPGLAAGSTATDIFDAFGRSPTNESLYQETLARIMSHLLKTHALPLSEADQKGIADVYRTFHDREFALRVTPTYAELMAQTDADGVPRSVLATDDGFEVVKALHRDNLVIPVVGDFAGRKTFRAVAGYLNSQRATVSTFYVSNVEQYLHQEGRWPLFCRNVAALPLGRSSTFIRALTGGHGVIGGNNAMFVSRLGRIMEETKDCGA